jgi:hypothetical protein
LRKPSLPLNGRARQGGGFLGVIARKAESGTRMDLVLGYFALWILG